MLIFFSILILLEAAALVGLFLAWRWLHNANETVLTLSESVRLFRPQARTSLATGEIAVNQVLYGFRLLERFLPWWVKGPILMLQWLGKRAR